MPVIYLSTGAWNTAPSLTRFLRRNGYPPGPMLLTDWGPTHTGWFRSGQDHKRSALARLARELPHVKWLLVGDDGQNDPKIYTEFATRRPDSRAGHRDPPADVGEQVLSHGIPVANDDLGARADRGHRRAGRARPTATGSRRQVRGRVAPGRRARSAPSRRHASGAVTSIDDPPEWLLPDPDDR